MFLLPVLQLIKVSLELELDTMQGTPSTNTDTKPVNLYPTIFTAVLP